MAIVHVIYAAILAFAGTVATALVLYGALDYVRESSPLGAVSEVLAGAVLWVYLLAFHLDGFTNNVARQLSHGGIVETASVLAPALIALITTDYLLRRIVPLVSGLIAVEESDGETSIGGKIRSRRSVLGATVGLITAAQIGGVSTLRGMLQSPVAQGNEIAEFELQKSYSAPYFPTALDFTDDGHGYLTNIEGKIFRFEVPSTDQESLEFETVASGINSPHGIEVSGDTLYTVDNDGAASDKYGKEEGYRVLQDSNGKVLAFDIESDGSLTNRRTIVSNLPVVNHDHALQQVTTGPDGRLYLSIGHLGGQKYPELFDGNDYEPSTEDHPNIEYLGTVISFEPDGSDVEIMARGLRNVYDITFDEQGNLFGANNDGMSMRSRVYESLCHITEGAHFGYPEYGTFDSVPSEAEVQSPLWTLNGVGSAGIETTDTFDADVRNGVIVGMFNKVGFVPVEREDGGVYVPDLSDEEPTIIDTGGAMPIVVESGPDDFLWIGSTAGNDLLTRYKPA
jgi:glucose/arabinose dehydrogenase